METPFGAGLSYSHGLLLSTMLAFPNAKINLGLYITSKRDDGYHNIESVFYPVRWCDVLEVLPATGATRLQSSGLSIPGDVSNNLILKAWKLLKSEVPSLPAADFYLHKTIPMGAGLGGGSADGAVALRLLNARFEAGLNDAHLEKLAIELGSDCPFFIRNTPQLVEGRGEQMTQFELDLSRFYIALVNPNIHVGTAEAYAGIAPEAAPDQWQQVLQEHPSAWRNKIWNQFEDSVCRNHPEIEDLKQILMDSGALYAAMTGSGSTVFGIFESNPEKLGVPDTYSVWKGGL